MDDTHLVDGLGGVAGFLSEFTRCPCKRRFAGIDVTAGKLQSLGFDGRAILLDKNEFVIVGQRNN